MLPAKIFACNPIGEYVASDVPNSARLQDALGERFQSYGFALRGGNHRAVQNRPEEPGRINLDDWVISNRHPAQLTTRIPSLYPRVIRQSHDLVRRRPSCDVILGQGFEWQSCWGKLQINVPCIVPIREPTHIGRSVRPCLSPRPSARADMPGQRVARWSTE